MKPSVRVFRKATILALELHRQPEPTGAPFTCRRPAVVQLIPPRGQQTELAPIIPGKASWAGYTIACGQPINRNSPLNCHVPQAGRGTGGARMAAGLSRPAVSR